MVQYSKLRRWTDTAARDRTIDRLLGLRAGLRQDVTSNNMANNLLWTRSDGTARVYALDPLGQQTTAPTPLVSGLNGYRAESLAGYDESDGFGLICDHRPPPIPRPDDFDDL